MNRRNVKSETQRMMKEMENVEEKYHGGESSNIEYVCVCNHMYSKHTTNQHE